MSGPSREFLCLALHGVRHALERARTDASQLEILAEWLLGEVGEVDGPEHRSKNNLPYQVGELRRTLEDPEKMG